MTAPNAAPPLTAERLEKLADVVSMFEGPNALDTARALRAHAEAMRECERRTAKYDKFGDDHYRGGFDTCDAILSILTAPPASESAASDAGTGSTR